MRTTTCDRCGVERPRRGDPRRVGEPAWTTVETLSMETKRYDLCPPCAVRHTDWITGKD